MAKGRSNRQRKENNKAGSKDGSKGRTKPAPSAAPLPAIQAVGGVLYQHDERGKPQYLLIKKRGGYWTLPKGKLNPNEDEIDALIREVAEETGLEGVVEQPIHAVSYKILKQGQLIRKHVNYYLVRIIGGALALSAAEKIIKAGWFPSTTAIRRLRRGRLRVIFRRAHLLLNPPKP